MLGEEKLRRGGVTILANSCKGELLFGAVTDNDSKYQFTTSDSSLHSLQIRLIGYEFLEIDLNEFWGFNSKIEVFLEKKDQSYRYDQKYRIEKYRLKQLRKNRIELIDANGKEIV